MSTGVEIVRTPDILHGKPRIDGTRIGVYTLGVASESGATVDELLAEYPTLDRPQVEAAIEYYESHPELMDYIRMQKAATEQAITAEAHTPDTEE